MDENKHLKNENNDLTERINNLSYILADLQQKTKNAEQERDKCNYCHASTNRGNQWCSRKQQCC